MPWPPTVVVVGGGVSGLATARFLASRTPARTVLLEAGPWLGGKVRTDWLAGLPLEAGPDGFLAEPAALALCVELGLGPSLVPSATSRAFFWDEDGLGPLRPEDTRGGEPVPSRLLAINGGLERLVKALAAGLEGVAMRRRTTVTGVERAADGRLLAMLGAGGAVPADRVVLAVPARAAVELLAAFLPGVAAALRPIRYLDLAVVNLVYPGRPWSLDGSGFLAAERPGRTISGCTWLSAKWPHLSADRLTAIRVTTGGRGGSSWRSMSDDALIAAVNRELAQVLGPAPPPSHARVVRWSGAIADPRCLDRDLIRGAQAEAREAGVLLAAGGYLGGGLASCIADAELAAESAAGPGHAVRR
jgi:protoporphyrinogen oxidase